MTRATRGAGESSGAEGGTRTPTILRPPAPQAGASANSATSAGWAIQYMKFGPVPDTRTARIELSDAGVVVVRIRQDARQSVSDASENVSTAIATRGGQRCPILVDIRKAAPLAADVRRMYSGQNIADAFTALALLIDTSPLGRTMGNVYFSVARLPMPMKMFADESNALEWLDGHRGST